MKKLVLSMMALFAMNSFATVIYTDIPDAVNNVGQSTDIDMNNDGTIDFTIGCITETMTVGQAPLTFDLTIYGAGIVPLNNNANKILGEVQDMNGTMLMLAYNLAYGTDIGASAEFLDTTAGEFGTFILGGADDQNQISAGNFIDQTGFIAVSFEKSGQTYFGWIRVAVTVNGASTSVTVMDFAYEDVAGNNISAGAGGPVGIEELALEGNVYKSNQAIQVELAEVNQATVEVYDLNGKLVLSTVIEGNAVIPFEAKGMFIVRVSADDKVLNKKLLF